MTYEDFKSVLKQKSGRGVATQLVGQAGVWAVAAQLAIRGLAPLFPGVDSGYDIMLENGLRLQVKARSLRYIEQWHKEVYVFDVCGAKWDNASHKLRKHTQPIYAGKADYYVFWGIDENRFWIVPVSAVRTVFNRSRRESPLTCASDGSQRNIWRNAKRLQEMADTEDAWHVLDVNSVAEKAIKEVAISS